MKDLELTKEISIEDVISVAESINLDPSIGEINQVLRNFDVESEQDPTATWDLIVENLLYLFIK
jgi:hypothetical protein